MVGSLDSIPSERGIFLPIYLALHPVGLLMFGEDGKLVEVEPFPEDPSLIAKTVEGLLDNVVSRVLSKYSPTDIIVVNTSVLRDPLERKGFNVIVKPSHDIFSSLRKHPKMAYELIGKGKQTLREYRDFVRKVGTEITRQRIKKALSSPDQQVIKIVDYIDHVNKSLNILAPAIREWYSVYFPELSDTVEDHLMFMKIVATEPDKKKLSKDILEDLEVPKELREKILLSSADSVGYDASEDEYEAIRKMAKEWLDLYETRVEAEKFLEKLMRQFAPNLSAVIHPIVGARLIAIAGSLKRLASLPASSIQILGAHKAIFMHLTKGTKPPKHGILFQAKEVRTAPKKLRGKIARLLATKIAIAARVDVFGGGKYIGDELKKEIEERLREIHRGA